VALALSPVKEKRVRLSPLFSINVCRRITEEKKKAITGPDDPQKIDVVPPAGVTKENAKGEGGEEDAGQHDTPSNGKKKRRVLHG